MSDGAQTYLGLPLEEFLGEVGTPAPMPGAGYCAGITLAMAAGLVAMAAGASREQWSEGRGAAAQANTLRERVAPMAQQNVEAYARAVARLRGEEVEGTDDLGMALANAAQIPLEIAEAAVDVAALAAVVAERGEQALRADAVAAALLAHGAASAVATLVAVNLGTTAQDERVTRVNDLVGAAKASADRAVAALR
jgi:formiminotetrahydrofolate cyclodeaminase